MRVIIFWMDGGVLEIPGWISWEIFCGFFAFSFEKNEEKNIHPKNSNENLGVSKPKSQIKRIRPWFWHKVATLNFGASWGCTPRGSYSAKRRVSTFSVPSQHLQSTFCDTPTLLRTLLRTSVPTNTLTRCLLRTLQRTSVKMTGFLKMPFSLL